LYISDGGILKSRKPFLKDRFMDQFFKQAWSKFDIISKNDHIIIFSQISSGIFATFYSWETK